MLPIYYFFFSDISASLSTDNNQVVEVKIYIFLICLFSFFIDSAMITPNFCFRTTLFPHFVTSLLQMVMCKVYNQLLSLSLVGLLTKVLKVPGFL